MILPVGFDLVVPSIKAGAKIFHKLRLFPEKLNMSTAVGDEGGFAPNLDGNKEALDIILDSIALMQATNQVRTYFWHWM